MALLSLDSPNSVGPRKLLGEVYDVAGPEGVSFVWFAAGIGIVIIGVTGCIVAIVRKP